MISVVKRKLSLKISLALAAVMLVLIVPVALLIIRNQMASLEQLTLEKAKLAANAGAQSFSMVLESAIEGGLLTVDDAFDVNYQEIKGYNWGDNPKYHTRYDFFTDKAAIVFQDDLLRNPDFLYAVGQDVNGYVPTHNTRYQEPVTGDPGKDLKGNRTKRIYKDPVGQGASRNMEMGYQQIYKRDTGATLWDVSTPVFVKGKHWGCFRIGVSIERIEAQQKSMLILFLALFGGFAALVSVIIFLMVKRSVVPIEKLTTTAIDISLGKNMEEKLRPKTVDEIGNLTKAVDRLRVSMKAAMERLGE